MKLVMHLGLSYACNMKCSHCFVDRTRDALSLDEVYRLLDEAFDLGVFIIYYTYGEPLLSGILLDVVNYAKTKGFVQVLMTNGYFIDSNWINLLKNAGINRVCISLDHMDEFVHDTNRGIRGAQAAALNAMELMVEQNINVGISTTVNDSNVDCLDDIVEYANLHGIKYISFLRQRENGIVPLLLRNQKKYEEQFIKCINRDDIEIHFHDLTLIHVLNELKKDNLISNVKYEKFYEMNSCHLSETLSVSPDGNVYECNLFHNVIGNVKRDSLKSILERKEKNNESFVCGCSLPRQS